jgi:hypothetical protein
VGGVRGGAPRVNGSALLDTNVFTRGWHEQPPLASLYAKHLFGQRLLITPQTLAEARHGALKAGWGGSAQPSGPAHGAVAATPRGSPDDRGCGAASEPVSTDGPCAPPAPPQRRCLDRRRRHPLERSAARPRCGVRRLSGAGSQDRARRLTRFRWDRRDWIRRPSRSQPTTPFSFSESPVATARPRSGALLSP